jgi:predicted HTH domain antitoxin
MGRSAAARTVQVEIPEEAFQHRTWEPREIAREMRVLWLLEEVRARRLGYGKAAELADMPVADFLRLMGTHQITPFDYDPDELARELGA